MILVYYLLCAGFDFVVSISGSPIIFSFRKCSRRIYIVCTVLTGGCSEGLLLETRSDFPRQPVHLHTQAENSAYFRDSSRVPRRRLFIYLKPPYVIGSVPRVYWVTQLRTDGVHCRESAGTRPVSLKVVPNECCLGRGHPYQLIYASLSHTHYILLILI